MILFGRLLISYKVYHNFPSKGGSEQVDFEILFCGSNEY
jgi:hypothetical protein